MGWARPDCAMACQLYEGFRTLRYNRKSIKSFLTRVFLKFSSVLKDHSNTESE